jgi:peptidoglycan hydrolase-like protein with peptidoglycan-binding domain
MSVKVKVLVVAAFLATVFLPGVAQAAPDTASATPHCTTANWQNPGGYIRRYLPREGVEIHYACLLSQGDANEGVYALQLALRGCYGYHGLELDKIFGPRTEEVLKAVQRTEGVTDDGIYGPRTRDAMLWPYWSVTNNAYVGCR